MKVNRNTKTALKYLNYITKNNSEVGFRNKRTAKILDLSHGVLEKIVIQLKKNGYVAKKGNKFSGYEFIKNPREISVLDVFKMFGEPMNLGIVEIQVPFKKHLESIKINDDIRFTEW